MSVQSIVLLFETAPPLCVLTVPGTKSKMSFFKFVNLSVSWVADCDLLMEVEVLRAGIGHLCVTSNWETKTSNSTRCCALSFSCDSAHLFLYSRFIS